MTLRLNQMIPLAVATACLTFVGSAFGASAGYKQAEKTGAGIANFRDEITKATAVVNDTVKALSDIATTADKDPAKAFKAFSKSLKNLESVAAKAKKRADDMRAQGKAYFAAWEKQLAEITNPDIKKLAVEQREKLQESFDNIKKVAEPLKAQFDPWMADLKDLEKYLGNDLSVSGVDAAKSLFAKTQAEGLEVQKSLNALVAELNTVAAALTPGGKSK